MPAEPTGEEELASLRAEICRVGTRLGQARGQLSRGLGWALAIFAPFVAGFSSLQSSHADGAGPLLLLCYTALLGIVGGEVATKLLAGRHHQCIRAGIRRRLAGLTPEQRACVLLPLQNDPGEAGEIVGPLLRELRAAPTEVSPSGAPGPGREVVPAKSTRG